jgi:hypothetical protein
MAKGRVVLDPEVIDNFYASLSKGFGWVLRKLIVNVDESVLNDSTNAHPDKVAVPVSCDGDSIPVPYERRGERSKLTAAVAADAASFKALWCSPARRPR